MKTFLALELPALPAIAVPPKKKPAPPAKAAHMKTRAAPFTTLLAWIFLTVTALAFPTAEPPSITVNVGEEVCVLIHPPEDVTGPKSIIKLVSQSSTSVFSVTPGVGVEVRPSGSNPAKFVIKGLARGSGSMTFNWTDAVQEFFGNVVVGINILAPPESTANVTPAVIVGDPVSARTGEYFALEKVDLNLGGPMPLFFARYYASKLSQDGRSTSTLFVNRLHSFDSRIVVPGAGRRDVITNRGRVIAFEQKGKAWVLIGRTDIAYRLVPSGANFILGDPISQRMWTYDGTSGRLLKIEDGRGNAHTLTYTTVAPIRLQQVADGLGRTLTFTYNITDKLSRVTDHTGRHVDFGYTSISLTSATDPLGHTTTYTYVGVAGTTLTSYTRPEGNVPFTQVFTSGKVTSQTERGTETGTMAYVGATTTFTQPGGTTLVDTFAATGELETHTDEAGKIIALTNDATGRRASVLDREGDRTLIEYHALSGKPSKITNAEGRTVTMTYKPRVLNGVTFFDLAKVTQPDGASRSFTYDKQGNVLSATDQAGKKWNYTRNTRGQVLTAVNPLGGISTFTYDAAGNLASRKDPDTEPTTFAYDALNRLTTITRPGGATVTRTYDAADRLLTTTDERGKTRTFAYDDNDRLTSVTDPDTNATQFGYDVLDRVTQVTDRLGKMSSRAFGSRRQLTSVTDRNGNATTFTYDARLRPVATTDAAGKTWARSYDEEGLLVSAANPVDAPGAVKRNSLGRVVEAANALGHTASVARDAMQRVVQSTDPLGRATAYSYDKRGLLTGVAEQGTGAAKYDRDPLGSLAKITDPNGAAWTFSYTKAGRLAGASDPLGRKMSQTFDTRGRPAVTTFADGVTATRTFDAASNVTRMQFSAGPDLNFTHDNLNRLSTATDATTAGSSLAFTYDAEARLTNSQQGGTNFGATYDDGGRLATVSYIGGAVVVTYTYDTRNRLTGVSDSVSGAQVDFAYDDAGRVTGITRSNGVNGTFTYDAAGRLTRIVEGTAIDLKYTLNATGEVAATDYTAPLIPAAAPATQAFTFDKAAQITTTGHAYDARGRLTTSPGGAFVWDGASRLTGAAGVTLAYDALGGIIRRTVGADVTGFSHHYALGLAPIVVETPPTGPARFYVWTPGGRLLYSITSGTNAPVFYHFDRIGSTLVLSNAAGTITDAYAYGPYGEPLAHTGTSTQPFTYVGTYGVRAEGALFHMRARHYDPATARFLSRDPLWPSLTNPKRLNPYEYAAQSPGEFIDPEGTDEDYDFAMRLHAKAGSSWTGVLAGIQIFRDDLGPSKTSVEPNGGRPDVIAPDIVEESILDEITEVLVLCDMYAPSADDRLPRAGGTPPLTVQLPIAKPDGCGSAPASKLTKSPLCQTSSQRALNWSAILDEVADFEANTRTTPSKDPGEDAGDILWLLAESIGDGGDISFVEKTTFNGRLYDDSVSPLPGVTVKRMPRLRQP